MNSPARREASSIGVLKASLIASPGGSTWPWPGKKATRRGAGSTLKRHGRSGGGPRPLPAGSARVTL